MQILGYLGGPLRLQFSLAVLSTILKIQGLALSDRFYDDYLEAHSFLRGGIGIQALQALHQRQDHPQSSRCVPAFIKDEKYLLCSMNYGSAAETPVVGIPAAWNTPPATNIETPDTENIPLDLEVDINSHQVTTFTTEINGIEFVMVESIATSDPISAGDAEHYRSGADGYPQNSKLGGVDGRLGGEFFNRLDYISTAHPTPTRQTGLLRGELIKWEMNFEQLAKADSALASASLYLSYDLGWDTAAITGSHTASIGSWTTTSTYDIVNVSPFPDGPEGDVKFWASADFDVAVRNIHRIYRNVEGVASKTELHPTLTEAFPLYTGSAQEITLQGSFFGTAIYNSATANWNGTWGPYDKAAETLPFIATVYGADGTYTRLIQESWVVYKPFSGGNEADLVKAFAENGPSSMAFRISLWNSYRFKGSWPPSNSFSGSTRGAIHVNAVSHTSNLLPTARDAATVILPAATEVITKTKTSTNTLIPLFGRMAIGKGTSAERSGPQSGYRFLLWLPWAFSLCILLAICTLALAWHRISDFIYRQKLRATNLLRSDPDSTMDSSFWNLLPVIRKSTVRKVSGSQVVDPAKLKATRQRASKESFQSIELN